MQWPATRLEWIKLVKIPYEEWPWPLATCQSHQYCTYSVTPIAQNVKITWTIPSCEIQRLLFSMFFSHFALQPYWKKGDGSDDSFLDWSWIPDCGLKPDILKDAGFGQICLNTHLLVAYGGIHGPWSTMSDHGPPFSDHSRPLSVQWPWSTMVTENMVDHGQDFAWVLTAKV